MPHGLDIRAFDGVVVRVRGGLVEDLRGRAAELHPLALEADVRHPRGLQLLAIAVVVGVLLADVGAEVVHEEERQPLHLAEQRPLHGELLHLGRPAQLELLRRLQVLRVVEVYVSVDWDEIC